jgi:hypothetical protein
MKMEDDTKIKFSWMLVDEEEEITAPFAASVNI